MKQADRDRLVTLRKAKKRLIAQKQAAEEPGLSIRQVKRLVFALKKRGDKAVIHSDPVGGFVQRIWADAGLGIFGRLLCRLRPGSHSWRS
jgi:hypothetical protein